MPKSEAEMIGTPNLYFSLWGYEFKADEIDETRNSPGKERNAFKMFVRKH